MADVIIENFSLGLEEYTSTASVLSVDVIDTGSVPISLVDTFIQISGTVVSGITYDSIVNGYRFYCGNFSDFFSDEPLDVLVHGENTLGEFLEQTFTLLYGYNVEYQLNNGELWDWEKDIIVWATVENNSTCPARSTDAWYFTTIPRPSANLGAFINPINNYENLGAVINPQILPKSFFYGAKIKLVVRAKDLAGNDMEPFILEFTIEDLPN